VKGLVSEDNISFVLVQGSKPAYMGLVFDNKKYKKGNSFRPRL
jgi:hypothetical protein